jgi:hypothetical protein
VNGVSLGSNGQQRSDRGTIGQAIFSIDETQCMKLKRLAKVAFHDPAPGTQTLDLVE